MSPRYFVAHSIFWHLPSEDFILDLTSCEARISGKNLGPLPLYLLVYKMDEGIVN
jgi:hypothetical protein